jgi:hypothetical protein
VHRGGGVAKQQFAACGKLTLMSAQRQTLAARLMTVQNNYVLGMASLAVLTAPEAIPILQRDGARFGGYDVQFAQVALLIANTEHRDDACRSFMIMHMCSLVKDSFELCRHHCKLAGNLSVMQAEPWYQFCRLIRNCIAHNFLFAFSSRDITLLPLTWRGRTIIGAMNGGPLPLQFFSNVEAWEMFVDVRTFAERSGV